MLKKIWIFCRNWVGTDQSEPGSVRTFNFYTRSGRTKIPFVRTVIGPRNYTPCKPLGEVVCLLFWILHMNWINFWTCWMLQFQSMVALILNIFDPQCALNENRAWFMSLILRLIPWGRATGIRTAEGA